MCKVEGVGVVTCATGDTSAVVSAGTYCPTHERCHTLNSKL